MLTRRDEARPGVLPSLICFPRTPALYWTAVDYTTGGKRKPAYSPGSGIAVIQLDRQTKRILYVGLNGTLVLFTFLVLLWIYRSADGFFQFALLTLLFLCTCLFIYQHLRTVFYDSPVMRSLEAVSRFLHSTDEVFLHTEEAFNTADSAIELMNQLAAQPGTSQELAILQDVANLREELRDQVERSRKEHAELKSEYDSLQTQITELGWIAQASATRQYAELQRSHGMLRQELEQVRSSIPSDQSSKVNELSRDLDTFRRQVDQARSLSRDEQNQGISSLRLTLQNLDQRLNEINAVVRAEQERKTQLPGPPGEKASMEEWFWYKYLLDCTYSARFTHAQMAEKRMHSHGDVRNRYSEWRQVHGLPDPEDVFKHKVQMPDKPSDEK